MASKHRVDALVFWPTKDSLGTYIPLHRGLCVLMVAGCCFQSAPLWCWCGTRLCGWNWCPIARWTGGVATPPPANSKVLTPSLYSPSLPFLLPFLPSLPLFSLSLPFLLPFLPSSLSSFPSYPLLLLKCHYLNMWFVMNSMGIVSRCCRERPQTSGVSWQSLLIRYILPFWHYLL